MTIFTPYALAGPKRVMPLTNVSVDHIGLAKIAILMCTYNGESFLADQLDSFERQTHRNWILLVSDDGSEDETLALLNTYAQRWGSDRMKVLNGPRQGFVANFLSLTCLSGIDADFFAWSDQDDIWNEDKLEAALKWQQTVPAHLPALYCGRTELVCESGERLGYSPHYVYAPHFANALVQNIGGGNTMMFNKAAHALLKEAGAHLKVPSHDWWAYQLISGVGGAVYFDTVPRMQYRQHANNIIGSNVSWAARRHRLRMLFQGRFYEWNEQNIHALTTVRHHLTPENQRILNHFKAARKRTLIPRVANILRAGLYRQTLFGNLGLMLAAVLKKI